MNRDTPGADNKQDFTQVADREEPGLECSCVLSAPVQPNTSYAAQKLMSRILLTVLVVTGFAAKVEAQPQSPKPECELLYQLPDLSESENGTPEPHAIEPEWLQIRLEADSLVSVLTYQYEHKPDGSPAHDLGDEGRKRVEANATNLTQKMKPGDEIWTYSTPAEMWGSLAGQMGVLILRRCTIVDEIFTLMN